MAKRRIVKIKKSGRIPKRENLKEIANAMGMTTKEYVDWLAQINRSHEGKRNRSAYLNLGPEVYKNRTGIYDRVEKGIKKK